MNAADRILATAPRRFARPDHHHLCADGILWCPVDETHYPPTQPAPAPLRCRVCGPITEESR